MMTRHIGLCCALIGVSTMGSGCSQLQEATGTAKTIAPKTAILVFFDVSKSTVGARDRYYSDFEKVLGGMQHQEKLLGDVISNNTAATATFPIQVEFPTYNPLVDNELTWKKKVAKDRTETLAQAKKLLYSPNYPESDLITAAEVAQTVFSGEVTAGYANKDLILFTDAFQQTKRTNFMSDDLTPQKCDEIISAQKKAGALPNLKGVNVWIAGASANASLSPEKMGQVKEFWLHYFEACGAKLPPEHYSTTLLNFNLNSQPAT